MTPLTLNQVDRNKPVEVTGFLGGHGVKQKLNALGIRKGKDLTKLNDSFIGGPVTVEVDNAKIAIGRGMADKILVKVVD